MRTIALAAQNSNTNDEHIHRGNVKYDWKSALLNHDSYVTHNDQYDDNQHHYNDDENSSTSSVASHSSSSSSMLMTTDAVEPSDCKAGGYYNVITGRCELCGRTCGEYQDEVGTFHCKTATLESCGAHNMVPARNLNATSLEEACKEVLLGTYYRNSYEQCYPVHACGGTACGAYQDETKQTSCKVATLDACGPNRIPSIYLDGPAISLDNVCQTVGKGEYYITQDNCYSIHNCTGCGAYQDELGQTECKMASLEDCGPYQVPNMILEDDNSVSLRDACHPVPKGNFFQNSSEACYPVQPCVGCGAYQNETMQTRCHTATVKSCGADRVPQLVASDESGGIGAVHLQDACKEVPSGTYYTDGFFFDGDTNNYDTCYPIHNCYGCGTYQNETKQTSCNIASTELCGENRVPKLVEAATNLDEACQSVPVGHYFYSDGDNDDCPTVHACRGCGLYQNETKQRSCKEASCGFVPSVFAEGATEEAQACYYESNTITAGQYLDEDEYCVRNCLGCGMYSEENATSCQRADCPLKSYPVIGFQATSVKQVCQTLQAGQGVSLQQCSVGSCFERSGASSSITCGVLQDYARDESTRTLSSSFTQSVSVRHCHTRDATEQMWQALITQCSHGDALCHDQMGLSNVKGCDCDDYLASDNNTTDVPKIHASLIGDLANLVDPAKFAQASSTSSYFSNLFLISSMTIIIILLVTL